MEEQYVAYRKFLTEEEAEPMAELFKLHNIKYTLEKFKPMLGYPYVFSRPEGVELKISPEQFQAADKLLEEEAAKVISQLPSDYYLFSFSDDELYEVLEKPFDWTEEDTLLAQHLLSERGQPVSAEDIYKMKQECLEELRKPNKAETGMVTIGFAAAFMGGIVGVIIGYIVNSGKKALPNGEQVYTYDAKTRENGRLMFYTGIIMLIVEVIAVCIKYGNKS